MTHTAKIYGSGLYDLAMEDGLVDVLMEQLQGVRSLFRENPDYVKLLSEPSIPKAERIKLIDDAFGVQCERYLINFLKLLCEHGLVQEFAGCCEEYTQRYNGGSDSGTGRKPESKVRGHEQKDGDPDTEEGCICGSGTSRRNRRKAVRRYREGTYERSFQET